MDELLINIDKIHTTKLGFIRIKKNLLLDDNIDIINYIKDIILNKDNNIIRKGKNYYCYYNNIIITINSYNYCVITAHIKG